MTDVQDSKEFEQLLEYLRDTRGFDFTGYKRASLLRRVGRRMSEVGVGDVGTYRDYLELNADEFTSLFNTILINVTKFFRDPDSWEYLRREIIPIILETKPADEPLRAWCAGCASGEEAYTLAMMIADVIGSESFAERVKIYATDVDEEALAVARQGVYEADDVAGLPDSFLETYFEQQGSRFVFRPAMRRSIIFGRNDLVQDAAISRLDLLVCRNTLMYFNADLQDRIVRRLHFALVPGGYLFLGRAEMLLSHATLFTAVDLKHRVFTKVPQPAGDEGRRERPAADDALLSRDDDLRLRVAVVDASPIAQIAVDPEGRLVVANRQARAWFGLQAADVGRPLRDLEISYRPLELRSRIDHVIAERRPTRAGRVERPDGDGGAQTFDVQIVPLSDPGGELIGVAVSFADTTRSTKLQADLERTSQELESANEELQSTNEELETTNEELQSTVEELETTNEELQSTNEELETMNEELQSTNAELQAMNDELLERAAEIGRISAEREAILSSLRVGVAVVDRDLVVRSWNRNAEDLWGLRADEARGHPFAELDIGLAVRELAGAISTAVSGSATVTPMEMEAINRRGKPIRCRVTCTPLTLEDRTAGAVLVMEDLSAESA